MITVVLMYQSIPTAGPQGRAVSRQMLAYAERNWSQMPAVGIDGYIRSKLESFMFFFSNDM